MFLFHSRTSKNNLWQQRSEEWLSVADENQSEGIRGLSGMVAIFCILKCMHLSQLTGLYSYDPCSSQDLNFISVKRRAVRLHCIHAEQTVVSPGA